MYMSDIIRQMLQERTSSLDPAESYWWLVKDGYSRTSIVPAQIGRFGSLLH
jgi:hypothetical protein